MRSQRTPQEILALLDEVIKSAPEFPKGAPIGDQEYRWRGRAEAVLGETGLTRPLSDFRAALVTFNTQSFNRNHLMSPLHSAYATLELENREHGQDDFIPGDNDWQGYAAVIKVLQIPCEDLLVVDPYMDVSFFLQLAPEAIAKGMVRCLTAYHERENPVGAFENWVKEGKNDIRPIELRFAPKGLLHDRFLILDRKDVRLMSQSLQNVTRYPAVSITRVNPELARMKIIHYENQWDDAAALVS